LRKNGISHYNRWMIPFLLLLSNPKQLMPLSYSIIKRIELNDTWEWGW